MVSQVSRDEFRPEVLAEAGRARPGAPLHKQLETVVRDLIDSGQAQPGALMPGELELAAQLGVSRHTVRHALGVLSNEGLLHRTRGRGGGTWVAAPPPPRVFERGLDSFYAFAWEVSARGEEQRSFVLGRQTLPAGGDLATRLETSPETDLERIVRLRTANGEPLVLETAYLPHWLSSSLSNDVLERGSIYDALEHVAGVRVARARETIRPVVLRRAVAQLLGTKAGSAAFLVERTTWSDSGPIEWQESIIRGDRYLYSVELPRQAAPR
ncbi:MAG: GntR family transcriptional regulator [Chloroflexi bacterium]|nr:GntR family transcriptional regulator [Chloroflexota bacterium]